MIENDNISFYRMQYEMMFKNENSQMINMEYSKSRVNNLLDLIKGKPAKALELGSGLGVDAVNMYLKGISVDAIEIVPELNAYARKLQKKYNSRVNFIQDDFLRYEPNVKYDLIYYMDGFGVSTYDNQVLLLNKIAGWLERDGYCVIEVYNPKYWMKVAGQSMQILDSISRKYEYDYDSNSFLDTWKLSGDSLSYTQVLQCYSLKDMEEMIGLTELEIVSSHPGGAMDFEKWEFIPKVSLDECLNYQLLLRIK